MHGTCLRNRIRSLMTRVGVFGIGAAVGLSFMLAVVFDMELAKTEVSFLAT